MTLKSKKQETATFAGGCFWCTEAIFKRLKGVESVISGYSGGSLKNPSYEAVSSGVSGHAESIQIIFDPAVISYTKLLDVFFKMHDPTTLNRQGADTGTQYRSVVFYHTNRQKEEAQKKVIELNKEEEFNNSVVTQVIPFSEFYPAEDYHKDYYEKNKNAPYCRIVIDPKIQKLYKDFQNEVKKV